ncbi:hypothetical protein [Arhodomonas sp. SL1]|uniref:hypothetical protein n=1 Tax=Arhodomonas sp. SL1 TaxID=3425691 RepID=UPI003F8854CD
MTDPARHSARRLCARRVFVAWLVGVILVNLSLPLAGGMAHAGRLADWASLCGVSADTEITFAVPAEDEGPVCCPLCPDCPGCTGAGAAAPHDDTPAGWPPAPRGGGPVLATAGPPGEWPAATRARPRAPPVR